MSVSLFGGTGFILSRYNELYPDSVVEPRDTRWSQCLDVLYGISTVHNYHPVNGDYHRDIDTNLTHLMNVLPYTRGTFNFVSSWFCFGSAAGTEATQPARESDPCDPNGFYGITKLAAEKLIRSDRQTRGLPYRILRLCSVIGNDPRAGKQKGAIEMMIGRITCGEDVDLYTGDAFRNILHVNDVCHALHLCMSTDVTLNGITNIGAPSSVRVYDLLQHALHVTKSPSRINLVPPPRFHQIVQTESFHMDTTKLRSLGFTPSMDPYEAVERVIAGMTLTAQPNSASMT